jgi:3-deoxy-D-manno-octulosonate 8-phosphate phosphatase (KDO 8-P phosphatase)
MKNIGLIKNVKLIVSDFDGVFTDNKVYLDQNGIESVKCDRSDIYGVNKLKENGCDFVVLSREENQVVKRRCEKLNLECFHGILKKDDILRDMAKTRGLELDEIAYIGNDVNDICCLKIVGTAIGVKDSFPEVIPFCDWLTDASGGNGALREVIKLFIEAKGIQYL